MKTLFPKWVLVTMAVALTSLVLTMLLGWRLDQLRRQEERKDCLSATSYRDDNRAMWLYLLGTVSEDQSPAEEARTRAFVAELNKRLPPLTCRDGDTIPGR